MTKNDFDGSLFRVNSVFLWIVWLYAMIEYGIIEAASVDAALFLIIFRQSIYFNNCGMESFHNAGRDRIVTCGYV